MVRIEELPDGVLKVIWQNTATFEQLADLPKHIRDKYEVMRATDDGTRIAGVGFHVSQGVFYIYDDSDEPDAHTMSLTLHEMFVKYGTTEQIIENFRSM